MEAACLRLQSNCPRCVINIDPVNIIFQFKDSDCPLFVSLLLTVAIVIPRIIADYVGSRVTTLLLGLLGFFTFL